MHSAPKHDRTCVRSELAERALSVKVFRRIVKTMLAALLVLVIGFFALCVGVDRYGRSDQAEPADAIVILGARVLADGQPGPDLLPRTEKAVALYRQGYAPLLICTGGYAGDPLSAAAVAARTSMNLGVPAEAIRIADGSNNTREDALRSADILAAAGQDTAIVVSHPLHLLRARLLFGRAGIRAYPSPTSTDVDGIPARWRLIYSVREAGLIVLDALYPSGELPAWMYSWGRRLSEGHWEDLL
jgi:uncharacterized SAM-binding protein YcdF (DUF218 family)